MSKQPKSFWQKFWKEIGVIFKVSLYFFLWLAFIMLLFKLALKDYNIATSGLSTTIISALIIAKGVLLMEFIPVLPWARKQPAIIGIVLRTLLYSIGVFLLFLLEKAFEERHENGGFWPSLQKVIEFRDIYLIWIKIMVIGIAILGYNTLSVVRQWMGEHELRKLFFKIPMTEVELKHSKNIAAAAE